MGPLAGNVNIGLVSSRSPFSHQSRGKRRPARSVDDIEPDPGKRFLKMRNGKPRIINDVNGNFAFRFSGLERLVPLELPPGLRLGSCHKFTPKQEKQREGKKCG